MARLKMRTRESWSKKLWNFVSTEQVESRRKRVEAKVRVRVERRVRWKRRSVERRAEVRARRKDGALLESVFNVDGKLDNVADRTYPLRDVRSIGKWGRGCGGKVQAESYREDAGCFHDVVFVFDAVVRSRNYIRPAKGILSVCAVCL